MADVVAEFLTAARRFRDTVACDADVEPPELARMIRNAVARVYLAATLLPPAAGDDPARAVEEPAPDDALASRLHARLGGDVVARRLALIDEELSASVSCLEDGVPQALRRVWIAFERSWGTYALDVLEPLHRIARHDVG